MKRLCALLLTLALVMQCIPLLPVGVVRATETENVQESSEEPFATIEDGSFELSEDNTLSDYISAKGSIKWNGADLSENWYTLLDEGNVNFELVKDASIAQDGQYCVKITPDGLARGGIQYRLPASKMVEGAEYVIRVWFKGTGDNDFNSRIQAVYLASGNATSSNDLTDEWTCAEHRFTYTYVSTRDPMPINIGMFKSGSTGSIYIDNISIECLTPCESITLNTYETWLEADQTYQLIPTAYPIGLDPKAVYTTSDESVATVDANGKITAHNSGDATITVEAAGGASAQCVVHVVDQYVPTTAITMEKAGLQIASGQIEQLKVLFTPADATNQNVIWSSSDEQVVTVDASGTVTALCSGTATVTATSGMFYTTCQITVAEDTFVPDATGSLCADFGIGKTIDLSEILPGSEYSVIAQPTNGMVELNGSNITYTSYTWLMDQNLIFTDQTYGDFAHSQFTDTVLIAVTNGDETETIELKVTINPLADLFYDAEGAWITDAQLLFSEEKLASIKSQLTNKNSIYYELLQNLIVQLRSKTTSTPTPYVKPDYASVTTSYDTNSRSNADTATGFIIGYLLTKDVRGYEQLNEQYLEKSIEWLEAMLWYPFWGTLGYQNNDLAGGHHLFATALAYTYLKEELQDRTVDHRMGTDGSSEEAYENTVKIYEDQPFLEALEMRLWQAGRDMYSRNYTYDCYVMNHLHVRMGGLSAAATALRGQSNLTEEQQEELIRWNAMVLYKDGNAMRFAMPDGTSQEGILYWEYGAEWLIKAGLNSHTALGIDLFEMTEVFRYSGDYLLYNLLPTDHWQGDSSVLNVGDSSLHHGNGPSYILRFIAGEYGDQNAQWLAQMVEDAGIDNSSSALWMSLFVADPSVQATKPSLDETLHWFEDMDHVIARSDWSGNEDLLSVKSGIPMGKNLYEMVLSGIYGGDPDAGHAHPDAGHITLFANGEFLLKDDGYADKYTSNHNTLLVNGKGQLGEGSDWLLENQYIVNQAQPCIKLAISNEAYDYIVSDATEAYAPELGLYMYERNVLWLKQEQILLVVDNILAEDGTQLELRWSTDIEQVAEISGGYQAVGDKNVMNIYPFTQSAATSYETVLFYGENDTYDGKALRQQYTGSNWQNAIAFSWNDIGLDAAEVSYDLVENDVHQFEVGCKTYSINVASNQVTTTEGGHTAAEAVKENEKAATCVAAGSYDSVVYCSICKAEVSRETLAGDLATGEHSYVDGVCSVCGAEEVTGPAVDESLVFMGTPGLSFQDYIGLQIMFRNKTATNLGYDSIYVEITQVDYQGNATTVQTTGTPYGSSYTFFEQQILSWSMTEKVTMTLYGVKGEEVYQGASFTTSVEELALAKIPDYVADGDMARAKALVDMLNFGAAVQTAYTHNENDLPNADLGDLAQYGTTTDPEFTAVNDITGTNTIKVYSNNISMQSKVEFQFMVKTTALEGMTVVAKMGDTDATVAYEPFSSYTIIRVACGAAYMREGFTIYITDAEGNLQTCTYNVTVEAYAAVQLSGEKAPAMKALITYGDAVAAI